MSFKEWLKLQENTSTANVAHFAMPIMPIVRRFHVGLGSKVKRFSDKKLRETK